MKTASIIINNYNYARFIEDAINSALNQDYEACEVIVVDDGSIDHSTSLIEAYGNRIIPVFKMNGGQASALNAGFEKSKGDVIIFLDSDDMLLPTAVKKAMKAFEEDCVSKVHWPMSIVNADGIKTGEIVPRLPLADGNYFRDAVEQGPDHKGGPMYSPPTSGIAFSRDFLQEVFPLQEPDFKNGGNDYLLSALSPVFGIIRSIKEPQGFYRIHGNNDTSKPLDSYMDQFFRWYEVSKEKLSKALQKKGFIVPPTKWLPNSWFHKVQQTMREIAGVVNENENFILVDGNSLAQSNILANRQQIPFTEKAGVYNGEPENDASAIEEIEKQRHNKVPYLIFTWTGFWYLDHYSEMHRYIRKHFPCIFENERVIVFNLQQKITG